MFEINKNDIVLCAIQKKEDEYLEEWLRWYVDTLGFDKVYIFDDEDCDDINILKIPYLKQLENEGVLYVKKCNGIQSPQMKMYNLFYKSFLPSWVAYFDCDEFLYLPGYKDIHEFVKSFTDKHEKVNAITFPWEEYGSNNQLYKTDGDVQKRFTKPWDVPKNMTMKKYIIKGGIPNVNLIDPHNPTNSYGILPNVFMSNGTQNYGTICIPYNNAPYIKHFLTKSAEECVEKTVKGRVFDGLKMPLNHYFEFNPYSEEAAKVLSELAKKYNETMFSSLSNEDSILKKK